MLLSIERFVAVVRPMVVQDLLTKRVLIRCVLLVWLASAIMNMPYFFAVQYMELLDESTGISHSVRKNKLLKIFFADLCSKISLGLKYKRAPVSCYSKFSRLVYNTASYAHGYLCHNWIGAVREYEK